MKRRKINNKKRTKKGRENRENVRKNRTKWRTTAEKEMKMEQLKENQENDDRTKERGNKLKRKIWKERRNQGKNVKSHLSDVRLKVRRCADVWLLADNGRHEKRLTFADVCVRPQAQQLLTLIIWAADDGSSADEAEGRRTLWRHQHVDGHMSSLKTSSETSRDEGGRLLLQGENSLNLI